MIIMLPMKMTDRRPAVHPSRCGHHLAVHGSGPPYLFGFFIPFLFVFSFRTKQITHTDGRTDGLYYFSILFFCFGHSPLLFVAWATLLAPHFVAMVPKSTNANGSILRFV
jgi:hypothetical protein